MPAYYKKTNYENNILPETLPDFWAKKRVFFYLALCQIEHNRTFVIESEEDELVSW